MSVEELWNRNLMYAEANRQFVDCKLLDQIIGSDIKDKTGEMEKVISEMLAGTGMVAKGLIRKIQLKGQRSKAVCIPARLMQLVILNGFKKMPWNDTRRKFVEHFFPKYVLPYGDLYYAIKPITEDTASVVGTTRHIASVVGVGTTSTDDTTSVEDIVTSIEDTTATVTSVEDILTSVEDTTSVEEATPTAHTHRWKSRSTGTTVLHAIVPRSSHHSGVSYSTLLNRTVTAWRKPGGSVKFWRQVFWFIKHRGIRLEGLIEHVKRNAEVHHYQSRRESINLVKFLVHGLLPNRGSSKAFSEHLSIAMRTGSSELLLDVIRRHLATPGLNANLVPALTMIKTSTASIVANFIALCKPEITYSGFRVDLVSSVKVAAFLLFRIVSVNGLRVDIWGDGCEIGGMEITRLTFRLLFDENPVLDNTAGPSSHRRSVGRRITQKGPTAQSSDAVFCFAGKYIDCFIV